MSYIGNTNTTQGFVPAVDYFNGNGSTTAFTLSRPVASVAQVQAVIENVPQNPGSAFTVSGSTITFTSAPPSGTSNIYVYYTSPITQVIQPGQGTVGTTQLAGGTVSTTADITANGLTVGKGAGAVSTNTAVGASALAGNTSTPTGINNLAVGYQAGFNITSGSYQTAVGASSLKTVTTGTENTAVGYGALESTTTGSNNVAQGLYALRSSTTANNNTAVGYQAGYSTTTGVGYNTLLGWQAGYALTTGGVNTLLGAGAGSAITTGAKNSIIGNYSGNQGGLDIRTSSNYIVLSDGDGNPRGYWSTSGVFYQTGPELRVNPSTATDYALFSSANNGGTFYAGIDNSSGSVFGNGAYVRNIFSGGAYRLYVTANSAGVYLASGGTSWTSASDERFKTDLQPIENAAEKVSTLRSVTGRYVTDEEGTSRAFLIAQDVQAVFPQAVDATEPEKLGVQYTDVIPLLVAAIKELKADLDATKAELAALKGPQ